MIKNPSRHLVKTVLGHNDFELTKNGVLVHGNAHLNNLDLKVMPFKFFEVRGDFDVEYSTLTSFVGFPKKIKNCLYISLSPLCMKVGNPALPNTLKSNGIEYVFKDWRMMVRFLQNKFGCSWVG